ncbi:MAG: VWA domain-containing protein [Candidatus Tectomicrobia bacterium]|uniref:VWA domain-containing protein n=1 Tax=Tectimicrobiota bacterium TaxID=2528274 RepID=A0A932CMW2_UNCTE|nr:VWA domain-containing protein [Candidatus Tectomicrobia bacterium]
MKIKGFWTNLGQEEAARTTLPLHVVLLIDCSGSMKAHLEAIRQAASRLADQIRERGQVGVVSFGGNGVQILSKLTDNGRTLRKALASLKVGGASPMGAAISLADEEMLREEGAMRIIVLFSDGKPTNSDAAMSYVNRAREHGVRFITVGVGPKADLDFLKGMASHPEDCHSLSPKGGLDVQEIMADLSQKEYLPLSAQNPLFQEPVEFSLYAKKAGEGRYSLLLSEGQCLGEEEQKQLEAQGIHTLYIRGKDRGRYERGLERGIDRILSDRRLTLEKKGEIIYENASHALMEAFQDPNQALEVERLGNVSGQVLRFISLMLSERRNFQGLNGYLSHDVSLWTHSANVCAYGLALAQFLGWDHFDTLYPLGMGLLLHDLGKSRLPWTVRRKSNSLGLKAWVVTKRHPVWGANALQESLTPVPDGVYIPIEQHHEKLDGSGYPRGLKGREIHHFGRVAAIADTYALLTSEQPGRSAMTHAEAIRQMTEGMGQQLDPDYLDAFIRCLDTEGSEHLLPQGGLSERFGTSTSSLTTGIPSPTFG